MDRADYGISEDEVGFTTKEDEFLNVDESYKGLRENPINSTLGSFKRDYVRNERLAFDMWNQLNYFLDNFATMVNSNPYYGEMDIVKLIENVLDRYKNWMTVMRYNVLLGKEKMEEIQKVIDGNYVSLDEMDLLKAETAMMLHEKEMGWHDAKCVSVRGVKHITIPASEDEIKDGDVVWYRKGDMKPTKAISKLTESEEARV